MAALLFFGFVNTATLVLAQSNGTFAPTGNMITLRSGYTSTLLPNGQVLIAGGSLGVGILSSAELYDPPTRTFIPTAGMATARQFHSATLLPNGKVLIAGGTGANVLTSAELYDLPTGTFTAAGNMINGGSGVSVLLADGRVLIAHDGESGTPRVPAELYDPAAGTFSPTGDQISVPDHHQAALLSDGRVLLATCCRNEQIYDPATGTFGYTGIMSGIYQDGFAAVSLPNGRVLVQGGFLEEDNLATASADLYDPSQGLFNPAGQMTMARYYHTATVLGDETVLIAGGFGNPISDLTATASTAEIYDPASGAFSRTGNLTTARSGQSATLLLDGTVLITGGDGMGTAEIYSPAKPVSAPRLFPIPGDTQGQGAIWHATTGELASAATPATAGDVLSLYTTSLAPGGVFPPQVSIGGRLGEIVYFGDAPGYPGYYQVNFTVPAGIALESSVPVRLTYLGRPSNEVTIAVR